MSKQTTETQEKKNVSIDVSDQEATKELLTDMRINRRLSLRQIAEETGIPLATVGRMLKGVEAPEKKEPQQSRPQLMAVMIRQEDAAKIYALAIDEGFNTVEEFLEQAMLPWYRIKRDFEWKLKTKLDPVKFAAFINKSITDSVELAALKEKWSKDMQQRQLGAD